MLVSFATIYFILTSAADGHFFHLHFLGCFIAEGISTIQLSLSWYHWLFLLAGLLSFQIFFGSNDKKIDKILLNDTKHICVYISSYVISHIQTQPVGEISGVFTEKKKKFFSYLHGSTKNLQKVQKYKNIFFFMKKVTKFPIFFLFFSIDFLC
jgi:hypothetical protein